MPLSIPHCLLDLCSCSIHDGASPNLHFLFAPPPKSARIGSDHAAALLFSQNPSSRAFVRVSCFTFVLASLDRLISSLRHTYTRNGLNQQTASVRDLRKGRVSLSTSGGEEEFENVLLREFRRRENDHQHVKENTFTYENTQRDGSFSSSFSILVPSWMLF